jgi:hypothetical protein
LWVSKAVTLKNFNTENDGYRGSPNFFYDIALETHKGPPYIFYNNAFIR